MYEPKEWKNHIVEYPNRYKMTEGESPGLVYLTPAPGEISQQGTSQSAQNFNRMEQGIFEAVSVAEKIIEDAREDLDTLKKIAEALDGKINVTKGKGLSSNDYTAADKAKLDGIAQGANAYTHPSNAGNKHIPAGGKSGQILRWSADGTATWGADNNTTYNNATTTAAGLMSAADKGKLDAVAEGATKNTASSTTPKAAGTAAAGTESGYARGDHVHPAQTDITGNAGTATKLATARSINGMSFDGSANRINFGVCSTSAATAAKTVACTGFALITGAEITVFFNTTNTAANPTLNVNNTGAKPIYYRGAAISAGYLAANRIYTFRYTGSAYSLVGDINTNTTYNNATTTAAGLMSAADKGKLNSLSVPICYQGSFSSGTVTKALPSGKTKCLIIVSKATSNSMDCGAHVLTGLSGSMTAVSHTALWSSGSFTMLHSISAAGAITLEIASNSTTHFYTMIYLD